MKKIYKLKALLSCIVFCMIAFGLQAQQPNVLSQARIYIDAGHGGWGANDRPLATINYAQLDSNSFFESNSNLWRALSLRDELIRAGAGYVRMNRTVNGIHPRGATGSPNSRYPEIECGTVLHGQPQLITLSVIARDVEENNIDYFLSIHSDAASTDGALTNHLVLLFRGWDTQVGNGLVYARDMARAAWPYLHANEMTVFFAHTNPNPANANARGDMSFFGNHPIGQGGIETTPVPGGTTYRGHFGVLRHGADGFLSEGGFHTYHPERHRKLNRDYARQFGVRYSRAIRSWFGDHTETQGGIMGSIRDKSRSLRHPLYNFRPVTIDETFPLNHATVILQDLAGNELARYTTDHNWNGIFVFHPLDVGTYRLVFEPFVDAANDISFDREIEYIEVRANETSFINFLFGEEPLPVIFCDIYYDPVQDGNIAAAPYYYFEQVGVTQTVDVLAGLTVRRTLHRNGRMYVLAVEADRTPRLLILNPETGALIKEMSTDGIDLRNNATNISDFGAAVSGPNHRIFPLSDIAFTADGVLIGVNSTVVGVTGNAFLTGAPFNVYAWENDAASPQVLVNFVTGQDAVAIVGNNNSNFVGNSIAVHGCFDNFKLYFTSHPGPGWIMSNFHINLIGWHIENGVRINFMRNDMTRYAIARNDGANLQLTPSPSGVNNIVVNPRPIWNLGGPGNANVPSTDTGNTVPYTEVIFQWVGGITGTLPRYIEFSGDVPRTVSGATYFRYAGSVFMAVPVAEETNSYAYRIQLYDITRGFDNARLIGETEAVITSPALSPMIAFGVVDNADIDMYLLAGNQLAKFRTIGYREGASVRVFAYNLSSVFNETAGGYDISFELNYDALSVEIILIDAVTQAETSVIPLGALTRGAHQATILSSQIPANRMFNWSVRARGENVVRFARITDSNDGMFSGFQSPRSVAIDNSPESDYFGRIYISNTMPGTRDGRTTSRGIYVLSPMGEDVTGQGDAAFAGTENWVGTAGQNFRKLAVAADGRVFIADGSIANSGVYIMNPSTFEMNQMFTGTRDAEGRFLTGAVNAANYIGGRTNSIGIRGSGENTRVYVIVNHYNPANTWTQLNRAYDLGTANTWTGAASWRPAGLGSANGNNSIVPVAEGFWTGQFRGGWAANTNANPYMHFFSTERDGVTFNTFAAPFGGEHGLMTGSTANGGLAVFEPERLIALSYAGGVMVFRYEFEPGSNGVPTVHILFHDNLGGASATYEDFEFDFAGNLYAVSASGGFVSRWAMPTGNNVSTTPARSSMLLGQPATHEIIFSVAGGSGTLEAMVAGAEIVSGAQVQEGKDVVFTATPDIGYQVKGWTVNGVPVETNGTRAMGSSKTLTVEFDKEVTVVFELELGVGIETINLEDAVRIFPNPVRNELNIAADNNLAIIGVVIFNTSGQMVQTIANPGSQVDVSSLPQGIYFIRIETDRGTVTKRFVKE